MWEGLTDNLDALKAAAETSVQDPRHALAHLGRRLGLRPQLRDALLDAFAHEPGNSQFDVFNAVSRLASHSELVVADRDFQRRLMAASGRLVSQDVRHCSACGQIVPVDSH